MGTFLGLNENTVIKVGNTKIVEVNNGEKAWEYPSDWVPEPPDPLEGESYSVYKIYPTENEVHLRWYGKNWDDYVNIDWGDGSMARFGRDVIQTHEYDYDSLTSPILDDGAKTVLVKLAEENLNSTVYIKYNTQQEIYYNHVAYINMNASGHAQVNIGTTGYQYNGAPPIDLEALYIKNLPKNITFSALMYNLASLKVFEVYGEELAPTSMQNFSALCTYYQDKELAVNYDNFTQANLTQSHFGFNSAPIKKIRMYGGVVGYNSTVTYIGYNNFTLDEIDISEFNPTISGSLFTWCNNASNRVHTISFKWDTFTGAQMSMANLKNLRTINATGAMPTTLSALNLSWTRIQTDDLDQIIEQLCDRTSLSAGTLTLTYTSVGVQLSQDQIDAITAKNWTVVI